MKYILEIIAFVSGAVVMILELDGSRIIAPYLGTSTIVWTSLIGVILGSLSFGYWWGGKRADKNADFGALGGILAAAGVCVFSISYLKNFLTFISGAPINLIFATLIATVLLFTPATVALGMVTPYVARLKMKTVETSGRTIGGLYALSTLGSIIGTFLGGFFLISFFGSTRIVFLLCSALFALAAGAFWSASKPGVKKWAICLVAAAILVLLFSPPRDFNEKIIKDIDTRYSRVWIYDDVDESTGRPARFMTDSLYGIQGGIFLDDPSELVFKYAKLFDRAAAELFPGFTRALMIGAGIYSYPRHFIKAHPSSSLDIVEIDPELIKLAKQFFSFEENSRVKIIHEDGRIFLNKNKKRYEVILNDAFLSYGNIPFQLTTAEAVEKMYESLDDGGIVISNIISAISGPGSGFLKAEYATYKKIFPAVHAVQVLGQPDAERQNIMLIGQKLKGAQMPSLHPETVFIPEIDPKTPILTDEFAPIEKYMARLLLL